MKERKQQSGKTGSLKKQRQPWRDTFKRQGSQEGGRKPVKGSQRLVQKKRKSIIKDLIQRGNHGAPDHKKSRGGPLHVLSFLKGRVDTGGGSGKREKSLV